MYKERIFQLSSVSLVRSSIESVEFYGGINLKIYSSKIWHLSPVPKTNWKTKLLIVSLVLLEKFALMMICRNISEAIEITNVIYSPLLGKKRIHLLTNCGDLFIKIFSHCPNPVSFVLVSITGINLELYYFLLILVVFFTLYA